MFTSNRSNSFIATLLVALAALTSACISNDLPYPWVLPSVGEVTVVAVDADGHDLLDGPVQIDSATQSIVVPLSEWANIEAVDISSISFSDGTSCPDENIFSRPLNLTSPVEFRLEKYGRTTTWTISATQTIERVFTVGSQIGASQIDVDARTATAAVPTGQPLDAIAVRTLKLAGPSATYSPDIAGQTVDFTQPVKVTVTEYGQSTEWTLTVVQTDVSVAIDRIDAWTQVAWIYASAEEGKSNGLEYRRADGDPDQWTVVPADWITEQGGSFTVRLIHLDPQTAYVVRATSDDDHSAELQFTTGLNLQLPNSDFTQWHQDGKVWNPWAAGGTSFWDTGNRGATTLGNSNTTPIESAQSSTGYAGAMLETKFVGISILGKLAAGNLFAGDFVKVDGTNGILNFGREFAQRPTKLKARIKYTTAPITDASKSNPDLTYMKDQPDTCIVWCALTDWDSQYEIRTRPENRQLFSRDLEGVIAYGQFQSGSSIDDYIDVEIPLDYNATDRIPTYILVTASASKYGDYFTGGRGAVLYIESYELLYDY